MLRSQHFLKWITVHAFASAVLIGCGSSFVDQGSAGETNSSAGVSEVAADESQVDKAEASNTSQKADDSGTFTNSIGMKLVLIPKGTFQMGSPPSEKGSLDEERQHEVTLTKDYYLGAFEVTQTQYEKVVGNNPSYIQGDKVAERHPETGRVVEVDSSNHPVECVSFEDAVEFCRKLSELPEEKAARRHYRLPTEAEWEYACRAGSKTAYSFGEDSKSLSEYAWFVHNGGYKTHPVGEKKPNAWGLYDMHRNVYELSSDWYGDYPKYAVSDPTGPSVGGGAPRVPWRRYDNARRVLSVGGSDELFGFGPQRQHWLPRCPESIRNSQVGGVWQVKNSTGAMHEWHFSHLLCFKDRSFGSLTPFCV